MTMALDAPKGKCTVSSKNVSHVDMESSYNMTRDDFMNNWKIFENYKYCLVMENTKIQKFANGKRSVDSKRLTAFQIGFPKN